MRNGKDVYGFRGISGTITDISFSHMVVEKDNNDTPTVLYTDGRYNLSKTLVPYSVSQAIYLVYDTSNAAQLLSDCADMDGFLVGGASLDVEEFASIVRITQKLAGSFR